MASPRRRIKRIQKAGHVSSCFSHDRNCCESFGYVISTATGAASTFISSTYNGLPVVGFATQYFNNGTLTTSVSGGANVQAFYTGVFPHRFVRSITAP